MSSTIKVNNIQNLAGDDSGFDLSTNDKIGMKIANSEVVTVDTTGVVLNENSADRDFRVESNGNANMLIVDGGNDVASIGRAVNSTSTLAIQNKDDTNNNAIDVFNDNGNRTFSIQQNTSGDAQFKAFKNDGTQTFTLDGSGNLFVGKTSSASGTVGFEYNNGGQLAVTRSGDTVALLNRTSSEGAILDIRKDNTLVGSIGANGGQLYLGSGDVGLRFRYGSSDAVEPFSPSGQALRDDAIDLGHSSNRFDDIFATNTSIQTSDKNEKQDIASATAKELNVAKKLSTLFKTYKWKDAVEKKGDKARTHTGIIAQDIQSAFSAEGLDASKYGLFTSDTWWEKDKEIYETKEEAPSDATEKTRLGVRYAELFSFIFSSIEARLTALESK